MNSNEDRSAYGGDHLKERITHIVAGLFRKFYEDAGPLHTTVRQPDMMDRAAAYQDRETNLKLLERERDLLQEAKEALHRMEAGIYGICEECGGEIGKGRLEVSPTATLCIGCKREQEGWVRKKTLSFRHAA